MSTKMGSTPRLSARERLLAAAGELFYENGINTVGIDRVIEHAGIAKASLYACFGSKDERASADAITSDKIRSVCNESRAFIQDKFTDLCRAAGVTDPEQLAKQLVLLYDGASISAHLDENRNAVATARALAAQMLVLHNPTLKILNV